jgi:hypothetical protein
VTRAQPAKPGDLVIVEQDVEIRRSTLPSFDACPELACSATYAGTGEAGFGCSRIRGEVLARQRDLVDAVGYEAPRVTVVTKHHLA